MYLVAIAWFYVVLMMAVAEATSSNGTVLGAVITFVLYGVLPVSILMYLLGTPLRAKARREREALDSSAALEPDGSGHAAGEAIAPERKET
jgi:hypothetical protein